MPWNDVSEDSTYQTMSDVLTALTFILMLIMITSVMLPEDVVVAEKASAEDISWRTMLYSNGTDAVELDGVSYPDLAAALSNVAADDYVSVDVSDIASGEASFQLIQAVQLAGLKHVYLSKNLGGQHGH